VYTPLADMKGIPGESPDPTGRTVPVSRSHTVAIRWTLSPSPISTIFVRVPVMVQKRWGKEYINPTLRRSASRVATICIPSMWLGTYTASGRSPTSGGSRADRVSSPPHPARAVAPVSAPARRNVRRRMPERWADRSLGVLVEQSNAACSFLSNVHCSFRNARCDPVFVGVGGKVKRPL
jgi:hypothetical protein